ncbi:MAG: penicillin-binding protein 2 [Acidobacteria bacterium]|nr:penicillin-binding protein 2 [Acidobacteriota bacterium]
MSFPFIATLIFLGGLGFLIWSLCLSAWRYRSSAAEPDAAAVPDDFGPRLTSARLRYVRWAFALLVLAAFGFHVYWGLFSTGPFGENAAFAALKNKRDQRNRRDEEANLRGWIFDRHRDYKRTLAKYRFINGKIVRDYPLGQASAHLIGYGGLLRGDAAMERAVAAQPPRAEEKSWWHKLSGFWSEEQKVAVGPDLVLTIDYDLQKAAFEQLQSVSKGGRGAVVMLNPQTGEVLALVSTPSFDPDDVNNDPTWAKIFSDVKNRPLLNRALNEYYLPGSTFKALTAAAAIEARKDDLYFTSVAGGWTPPNSGRPIRDDEGEALGRLNLTEAFVHSSNQYFAQLGVELERQRMGEAAARFGLKVHATPGASIGTGVERGLWNSENKVLSDVFAPLNSTFVNGNKISKYDIALESIGQGYVQMTPFQMALIAAGVAHKQGLVMRPKLEMERTPVMLSQAMTAPTAARVRELMKAVVERGTAAGVFKQTITTKGITAGGKTGTAQREVTVIDPATEKPVMIRDERGRTRVKKEFRIDSCFIGFAPFDNPQIAFAVVVEGGGYGAKTAAPIAANLLVKAKDLDLLKAPPPVLASGNVTAPRN